MANFLWKPFSDGGLNPGGVSILLNGIRGGVSSAVIVGPNGQTENLQKASGTENGTKFYSKAPGSAFGANLTVKVTYSDGKVEEYQIPNGGQRYEGPLGDANPGPSAGGGGAGGAYSPNQVGQFGFAPADLTGQFPSPVTVNYNAINPAPYKFTDPAKFAKDFGNLNRREVAKNFNLAQDMALAELDTELQGLQGFVPAAAALKRGQTAIDNQFNQQQRSQQIQSTLPELQPDLNNQAARARTYAEGGVPDSIGDKALELGIRSRSADAAATSGFGTGSSIARKTSDLMSAERRVQLSQYGDQLLSQNVNQKAGIFLAPTEYANAGSQVNVNPTVSGSQLTQQNLQEVNRNTILDPATALGSRVQQNQFSTGIDQQTRTFNASNGLQNDQFNANNANNFALNKFGYQVSLAGANAGAAQTNANTELAIQQQQEALKTFQDALNQSQQSGQTGAIAQGIGAIISNINNILTALGFNGGSSNVGTTKPKKPAPTQKPGGSGSGTGKTPPIPGDTGDFTPDDTAPPDVGTRDPEPPTNDSGRPLRPGEDPTTDDGGPLGGDDPTGQGNEPADTPDTVDAAPNDQGFTEEDFTTRSARQAFSIPSTVPLKEGSKQGSNLLRSVGISEDPKPGDTLVGYNTQGRALYSNTQMARSTNTNSGKESAYSLRDILQPLGLFQDTKDKSTIEKIGQVSSDAAVLARLGDFAQRKDYKGFANEVLRQFQQPLINAVVKDPDNRAGLGAAVGLYQLAANWDNLSPGQKSLAVAKVGIQGYKFATGKDLRTQDIIPKGPDGIGLNVGQALNLFGAGYNVYGLVKNWDQYNTIQKIAGVAGGAASLANVAKDYNLLGAGTANATVPGITAQGLQKIGAIAAPHYGVGAIAVPKGVNLPSGYSLTPGVTPNGDVIAMPTSNLSTFSNFAQGAAGVAGIALGAQAVYKGWGVGGTKGAINGALGGSAVVAGLSALSGSTGVAALANPYLAGAILTVSVLGNIIKTGKNEDQKGRDGQRGVLQKTGIADKDYKVNLADGSTFDIGVDGHGQEGTFKGMSGTRRAWDTDYTNDLDFTAGIGSIALTRLLNGGKGKAIDQIGSQLGNAVLGKVGNGAEFSKDNFDAVTGNMRGVYSQAGIKTKADAYALANQAFAEGRINDSDLVGMHNIFNMMYDNNGYDTARKIMSGRNRGVEVAQDSPEQKPTVKIPKDPKGVDPGFSKPSFKVPDGSDVDPGFNKSPRPQLKLPNGGDIDPGFQVDNLPPPVKAVPRPTFRSTDGESLFGTPMRFDSGLYSKDAARENNRQRYAS